MSTGTELQPPLPKPGVKNILVTSALPYVNNYPHLGNIIGAVLSADVYARYSRQRLRNTLYVCGTDEYGTATETKAQQEKLTPRQICDKYHTLHKEVYDWFDIHFDVFGRTSTERQTEIVQEIFWDVYNNGYVTRDAIVQLFCEKVCHRFLADRYVNGTCPNCGYDDARGDQCDACGHMLNPEELIRPKCATCRNPPVPRSTEHLFIDLPKIEGRLKTWAEEAAVKGRWTPNAKSMTETWFRDGLKPRCITRDLKWGVPVPLEGFKDKVFYVWFDAPIGYPSITASLCGDKWREWWIPEEGKDVQLIQFMGKDNVPFHTIVFPSSLLATGKKWTMLHHISTTEYLNYESGKFSKSRGIGVFGNDARESGIPSEVWRYYLILNRPEGSDSVFAWEDLAVKNNDELIKTLGNYINRTVTFLDKFFDGVVPEMVRDEENDEFVKMINVELKDYIDALDKVSLKAGLKKAMAIASLGNLYLQRKQPWKLIKDGNRVAAGSSLTFSANLCVLVTVVLEPFLGTKFSKKVYKQLGLEYKPLVNNVIPDTFEPTTWVKPGQKCGKPAILFTALTKDQIETFRNRYGGKQDTGGDKDDSRKFTLDLRVGKIVEISDHPESERLFVAKVDIGETEPRSVVAGLRDFYKAEELRGVKVVLVCNLAPATLAGIESQGMVLTAEKKKAVKILCVGDGAEIGDRIAPVGVELVTEKSLDRKGFQTASKLLRVGKGGDVVFDKTFVLCVGGNERSGVSGGGVPEGGKIK